MKPLKYPPPPTTLPCPTLYPRPSTLILIILILVTNTRAFCHPPAQTQNLNKSKRKMASNFTSTSSVTAPSSLPYTPIPSFHPYSPPLKPPYPSTSRRFSIGAPFPLACSLFCLAPRESCSTLSAAGSGIAWERAIRHG